MTETSHLEHFGQDVRRHAGMAARDLERLAEQATELATALRNVENATRITTDITWEVQRAAFGSVMRRTLEGLSTHGSYLEALHRWEGATLLRRQIDRTREG